MPQTGMFRMADGTLRAPKWNCTLSGALLEPVPEADLEDAVRPLISTTWSAVETKIMKQLFPRPESLCMNFGRTKIPNGRLRFFQSLGFRV